MSVLVSRSKGRAIILGLLFVQLILHSSCVAITSAFNDEATTLKSTPNDTQSTGANTSSTTTTTTTTTTTVPDSKSTTAAAAATAAATTTAETPVRMTMREPSEQEINEARKIIHEIASTIKDGSNRVTMNKPSTPVQAQDFAPDSPEARVADATTQFGLNLIKSLPASSHENAVVSPVSLQILLNLILLGTDDQSATQAELAKVLGYESNGLLQVSTKNETTNSTDESKQLTRNRPHAAMHSLLESISHATHLIVDEQQQQQQQQLLNSNPQLAAHLQTSVRDNGTPLSGQVNFTLANLMLTNLDLVRTSPSYEKDLKSFYDAKLEHFSNANSTSNTTNKKPLHERINSWVQNATRNQISELVKEADLSDDDLAVVLLNAAHFKGHWLHTFNSKLTQERTFYNEGQTTGAQEVKFMRQNGVFGYAEFGSGQMPTMGEQSAAGQQTSTSDETVLTEDLSSGRTNDKMGEAPVIELSKEEAKRYELTSNLNCSVLMMPFSLNDGQELSMVILLPSKRDGLRELIANLNGPALNEIYKSLNEQHVQVEIPKFSFESSLDAKSALEQMGLARMFQKGADLGRMLSEDSPKNLAKVDKVLHKAKIAVDELGAEAAAASAATIVLRNLIRPPNPSFVADHPFLFVIRHNRSNLPLFMGTIEKL
jgi:serine protease inhibitor